MIANKRLPKIGQRQLHGVSRLPPSRRRRQVLPIQAAGACGWAVNNWQQPAITNSQSDAAQVVCASFCGSWYHLTSVY
jgi:hypothetical protein